jgi:hypothetical protein
MKSPEINVKDLLKIVGLLKKLSFFKDNLALLVPIVIMFVAGLVFIPTTLLSGSIRKMIAEQSVKPSAEIDGLLKKVDQAAEAEAMESYINAYAQDANALDNLMLQTTQRELLSYKLFPDMNETSPLLFDPFRQKFVAGVEAMLKRLNAGGSPSDAEINATLEASSPRAGRGRSPAANSSGGGLYGTRRSFRMMTENDRKIVAKVCEDKARAAKVYVNAVDVGGYAYWSDWKFEEWDKAIRDCWYWQMAYWILEDVTASVEQMNKDADNILHSPVKRVMGVLFTQARSGRSAIGGRARRTMVAKDKQTPTYVASVKSAMSGAPCTGRSCNETLDVMQFEVHVIINAGDVMRLMQELCGERTHKFRGWRGDQPEQTFKHNQISILESQVTPVDREDLNHSGYEYGPDEVVDVDLICEYVFNKAAYGQIQPKAVLEDIANAVAPTTRR